MLCCQLPNVAKACVTLTVCKVVLVFYCQLPNVAKAFCVTLAVCKVVLVFYCHLSNVWKVGSIKTVK